MEEKKQTNKLSYSVFGKHFRGFLCMVTFCVFCVSAMLTTYVVGVYNPDIVTNPATKYDETNQYQDELFCEISTLLHNINEMDCYDVSKEEISILDMSEKKEYFYDALFMGEANYNDVFEADYLEEMTDYEIKNAVSLEDRELEDYENMKTYLESDTVSDYVYFDEESFRALFENDGLQNTDCRFSDKFSEDAYFIFENYEVTTKRESRKSLDVSTESKETEEENAEATTEAVEESKGSKEENVNSTEVVDDYEIMDGDEIDVEVETEQVVITPYNLTSYAVYDPEQDIYYSTWDEYFSPMTSYAYSTEELLGFIQLMEEDGTQYNSLVIPLLKCYNTGLDEIAGGASETYNNVIVADSHLQSISERNIMFYFLQDDSKCYMNMSEPEMVKEAEIWYGFEKLTSGDVIQTHSDNVVDLQDISEIEACFEEYPSGAFLYVGFSPQSLDVWGVQYYSIVRHYKEYPFLAKYSLMFAILTVVSFILLLIQAVWLIRTTGKTCKEDTEVSLNFFDRLYTEIWFVISGIILLAAACVAAIGLDWMLYYTSLELMCVCAGGGALPFGFAFMVLTLSFVRRIKAHNLWNRMLIVKLVKSIVHKIKNKKESVDEEALEETTPKKKSIVMEKLTKIWIRCKEAYYGIKGTRKLLLAFVIFMIAEIIVVFTGVDSVAHAEQTFFIFLILQVIALCVVVWVVKDIDKLTTGVNEITKGNLDAKVEINEKTSVFGDLANGINHIGDGLKSAVETSLKDERMKTELITNVSHDLKTPLTSIINYIDLLKKEEIPGDDAKHYIEVLDAKSQRLKQLTEDLVEAAKATSGNIELEMMPLTFDELMKQALGEFEDKFEKKNLTIVATYPEEPAIVVADGRRLFRIIENVLQNIYKYAMEGTRVYADLSKDADKVTFTLKNVSAAPLNISPEELMERFTRGDSSRTTEGSGLGLSIAKDLTRLQNGEFEIQLDGDLFKVIIKFPLHK